MAASYQSDIDAIAGIAAVPSILDVVCRTTGMGFAAVARVTEDRWIACSVLDNIAFGLEPGGELKVETTICHEVRSMREAVVIDHVAEDPAYCGHPTPAMYGFQSYISMPILLPDGRFFGTLCAIDPKPAKLRNPQVIGMFKLFAELIAFHLDAHTRLAATEQTLMTERKQAELREQFIAVLGHDLRNPVAALDAGVKLLQRTPLDERARSVAAMMQNSLLRMGNLIENVLDFARGRLGEGLAVLRNTDRPLDAALQQVVNELQAVHPDREIQLHIALDGPVYCDRQRIAQLFSNLLGNALIHGAPDKPIAIDATTHDGVFELSVTNAGEPIPDDRLEGLFQPFSRGKIRVGGQGLGLGLYIASQIAKAHDGTLDVVSGPAGTCFTLRMPMAHDAALPAQQIGA